MKRPLISHDTAEFAVASLRRRWEMMGADSYPKAGKSSVTTDNGGSNGYRVRLWKTELRKPADDIGKVIHVAHYPSGTSKRNKIGHRMSDAIPENWRGIPPTDYETIVSLPNHTTTEKGPEIRGVSDERTYEKGKKYQTKNRHRRIFANMRFTENGITEFLLRNSQPSDCPSYFVPSPKCKNFAPLRFCTPERF